MNFSSLLVGTTTSIMLGIVLLLFIYTARHYIFTLNRLFGRQHQPYLDIEQGLWPRVVVCVAAHNEERVIADCLYALLAVDYPRDRISIMPVNDRSSDATRSIIDTIAAQHPGRLAPFHRSTGRPGKAAALHDAMAFIDSDIMIVFDADYLPASGLIKQLAAPFFDPEIGAVMGRVVPVNNGINLLTRLQELERSGGYQVDQTARMNLGLVPQYGGTVGGIRCRALAEIGGWDVNALAEDTDVTIRLLQNGWKTVYQNRSECYEEVPEAWSVRIKQIGRWSRGHNQVMWNNLKKILMNSQLSLLERLDGALLLLIFIMPSILLAGWIIAIFLFFISPNHIVLGWILLTGSFFFGALGSNAAFFEIAAAAYLDGSRTRIRLLPLNIFSFMVSIVTISRCSMLQVLDNFRKRELVWNKTERYRMSTPPVTPVASHLANKKNREPADV